VVIRGVDGTAIVRDDLDRRILSMLLADTCREYGWKCLTYCLLTNHLHLAVYTPSAGLADGMWLMDSRFARQFNNRHGRSGHLFQGRYYSKAILSERHLIAVVRYIAFNPVKAGLCKQPEEYRLSSHAVLLGERPAGRIDVSGMFGFLEDREAYRRLFTDPEDDQLGDRDRRIVSDARRGLLVEAIARRNGVCDRTVKRVLAKAGEFPLTTRGLART
jgi:REP element-mobilizing transposase RayT